MNAYIENTLSFLEQAHDELIQGVKNTVDRKEISDLLFAQAQIYDTIKRINDRCGKTAKTTEGTSSNNTEPLILHLKYTVHTDGACSGNPGPGGYGVIIDRNADGSIVKKSKGFEHTTNNRMELMAVIDAMKTIDNECSFISAKADIEIISDSKYVTDAFNKNWIENWQKKQFVNVANDSLWKEIIPIVKRHNVRFTWIKGHNGNPLNEECDRMAVAASRNPEFEDMPSK